MTYFLEKYYEIDYAGRVVEVPYGQALIRPCELDYETILALLEHKIKPKNDDFTIQLGGQVAMFDKSQHRFKDMPIFKTIDEWLIWLDLYKGISPDFEETHIHPWNKVDDFIIKTVDLRTKNVLYDSSETTICKLKEAQVYKHIRNVPPYSSS